MYAPRSHLRVSRILMLSHHCFDHALPFRPACQLDEKLLGLQSSRTVSASPRLSSALSVYLLRRG